MLGQQSTDLKGKDILDQILSKDEAGAGFSVTQEDLEGTQIREVGLGREAGTMGRNPGWCEQALQPSTGGRRMPRLQAFLPQHVPLNHSPCVRPPTCVHEVNETKSHNGRLYVMYRYHSDKEANLNYIGHCQKQKTNNPPQTPKPLPPVPPPTITQIQKPPKPDILQTYNLQG